MCEQNKNSTENAMLVVLVVLVVKVLFSSSVWLIGNEGDGISPAVLALADKTVKLRMVSSFAVS